MSEDWRSVRSRRLLLDLYKAMEGRRGNSKFTQASVALPVKLDIVFEVAERVLRDINRIEEADKKGFYEFFLYGLGEPFFNLRLDFESFFYFLESLLDVLAKITPYFYPEHVKTIPKDYFRRQRSRFITCLRYIDPEYATYLEKNTDWYEEMQSTRDTFIHQTTAFYEFREGKPAFGRLGETGIELAKDVRTYINDTMNELVDFLRFYARHFTNP